MSYLKISLGIFIALAFSRFIPHPPNFTSLIALSFYIPVIFGPRYLPALVLSFIATDLFIGFHSVTFFTWGSVIFIGLGSKFFINNVFSRICGSLSGGFLFYLITNFGVWTTGTYEFNINGLINCYIAAIPFFVNTLISTIFLSFLIEVFMHIRNLNILKKANK